MMVTFSKLVLYGNEIQKVRANLVSKSDRISVDVVQF